MNETQQAIKELIIEALNLEDMGPDDIETEAPLFGEGLGLDSIDALELGVQAVETALSAAKGPVPATVSVPPKVLTKVKLEPKPQS